MAAGSSAGAKLTGEWKSQWNFINSSKVKDPLAAKRTLVKLKEAIIAFSITPRIQKRKAKMFLLARKARESLSKKQSRIRFLLKNLNSILNQHLKMLTRQSPA